MIGIRKFLALSAAGAALAIASPASAQLLCYEDGPNIDLTVDPCVAPGNDSLANVQAAIEAATGFLVDLDLYGKSDDNPELFSFSPDINLDEYLATNWNVLDGSLIKYVTVKAADDFKVYEVPDPGSSSGLADTFGLINTGGNQPAISHISFWNATAPIPEPSTWAMLLFGFGGIGFAMRRRKSAERGQRVRVAYS